jgi:glycosyltransferase involved in cell wall biosynthesis
MRPHIILFFTRGVSLRTWNLIGNLDREIALYQRLMQQGYDVSFVTYGDASDLSFSDRLGGIKVLCNESSLPPEEYEQALVSLHGRYLEQCQVIKTNQSYGADIALRAARHYGKSLVARCGYMWSFNAARDHGEDSPSAIEAARVEAQVFSAADRVVVTTPAMKADVIRRIPAAASTITIIPNYVDTHLFRPLGIARDPESVLFVGRIAPEKNLGALIEAAEPLDVKLILIGEGKLRPRLQQRFKDLDGRVSWEGNIPNTDLPNYLNRAGCFVLPSLYEGHPKALIEAMSCATPVIGADSPGIRELVRHLDNGYLCSPDPEGVRAALTELLSRPDLCSRLGKRGRDYVVENYSLDRIVQLELAVLRDVLST